MRYDDIGDGPGGGGVDPLGNPTYDGGYFDAYERPGVDGSRDPGVQTNPASRFGALDYNRAPGGAGGGMASGRSVLLLILGAAVVYWLVAK